MLALPIPHLGRAAGRTRALNEQNTAARERVNQLQFGSRCGATAVHRSPGPAATEHGRPGQSGLIALNHGPAPTGSPGARRHLVPEGVAFDRTTAAGRRLPTPMVAEPAADADLRAMAAQLGRPVRGSSPSPTDAPVAIPMSSPTQPRLDDGSPFPTVFYLTCPRAAAAIGTHEGRGHHAADAGPAAGRRRPRRRLPRRPPGLPGPARWDRHRAEIGRVRGRHARPGEVPACPGGSRAGRGSWGQPLGDEVVAAITPWWERSSCHQSAPEAD